MLPCHQPKKMFADVKVAPILYLNFRKLVQKKKKKEIAETIENKYENIGKETLILPCHQPPNMWHLDPDANVTSISFLDFRKLAQEKE